jgi:tellurite resistance-related uncharacterized protein
MKKLPKDVTAYKRTPSFTEEAVPAGLLKNHSIEKDVWGLIQVESGSLEYVIGDDEVHILMPGKAGVVEPTVTHHVNAIGPVSFFVEFYR